MLSLNVKAGLTQPVNGALQRLSQRLHPGCTGLEQESAGTELQVGDALTFVVSFIGVLSVSTVSFCKPQPTGIADVGQDSPDHPASSARSHQALLCHLTSSQKRL